MKTYNKHENTRETGSENKQQYLIKERKFVGAYYSLLYYGFAKIR